MSTKQSLGDILVAKAKELDSTYVPDNKDDMGEALAIILNKMGTGSGSGSTAAKIDLSKPKSSWTCAKQNAEEQFEPIDFPSNFGTAWISSTSSKYLVTITPAEFDELYKSNTITTLNFDGDLEGTTVTSLLTYTLVYEETLQLEGEGTIKNRVYQTRFENNTLYMTLCDQGYNDRTTSCIIVNYNAALLQ